MTLKLAIAVFSIALMWTGQVVSADLPARASDSPRPPRLEHGIWAAISYSKPDGKYGFFWGADGRKEAMDDALGHCRDAGGKSCSIVVVFRNHRHWNDDDHTGFPYNHCGALAVGKATQAKSRPWGAKAAQTRGMAEDLSLRACEIGGDKCRIIEWVCT